MALPHTKPSGSARLAVVYITIGTIMGVWSTLWYIWMIRHGTQTDAPYFWCYGFFLTGLALIIIGLAVGRIGRAARHAESPTDVSDAKAPPAQTVAQPMIQPAAPPAVPRAAPVAPVAPAPPVAPGPDSFQPH
ncbi:MAG TPA: hypothetical protein VH643_30955 [Gemmataceae bacterium]|jgi:hypothetical protein